MNLKTLEVGCGNVLDFNYDIRSDIQAFPPVNYVADARHLSEIPDSSIALIKSAAFIEHLTPDEQDEALTEWYRILVPHGIVLTQTPDVAWIQEAEQSGAITHEWADTLRRGGCRDEHDVHKGLMDAPLLESLFTRHGFRIVSGRTGKECGGSLEYVAEKVVVT